MVVPPLFYPLPSRHSDSLSDTTLADRQLSDLSNKSIHPCYRNDQKRPRRWLVSFKSKLNPKVVGKKKATRNRLLVSLLLIIIVGGIAVL
jgi:hypothetical protein